MTRRPRQAAARPRFKRDASRAKHIPEIAECIGTKLNQGAKLPVAQQAVRSPEDASARDFGLRFEEAVTRPDRSGPQAAHSATFVASHDRHG
jgi:hypothetical protein